MALNDLSADYQHSAQLLKDRLAALRAELRKTTDPEEIWQLKRRIAELTPMLTEMNELAELTAHYYEKGHYRNAKYSANCFDISESSTAQTSAVDVAEILSSEDGSPAGYSPVARPTLKATKKKTQPARATKSLLDVLGTGKK